MKAKNIVPLMGILLIASLFYGCGKIGAAENHYSGSWKIVSTRETLFPKNIGGFFNKKIGITVGYNGEIHYTKNGGKKWGQGNNGSLCLFGLDIVDDKTAYACGNASYVVKTNDGGENWWSVHEFGVGEPNQPRYLSFVDKNTGWIATPDKFPDKDQEVMLGSTTDGGLTWQNIILPKEIEEISAIYLRDPENGYVLDSSGNLYITRDGGNSFEKQPLNIQDISLNPEYESQIALKFFDETNALIAYSDKDLKLRAARSNDGGKTWVNETVPDLPGGTIYLSQDGKLITLSSDLDVTVLEYK